MSKTIYQGVAHPWLCDIMGHLTTRHYVAMFDDASYHFLFEVFDWKGSDANALGTGWVDAKHVIQYYDEVVAGSLLEIEGSLIRVGGKSITCLYEMFLKGAEERKVVSSMEVTNVYFDTNERKAIPLSDEMREKADTYLKD